MKKIIRTILLSATFPLVLLAVQFALPNAAQYKQTVVQQLSAIILPHTAEAICYNPNNPGGYCDPTNVQCAATHYNCIKGTPQTKVDGATAWTWTCKGYLASESCSESKGGTISVSPTAVRFGQAMTVSWNGANYGYCKVRVCPSTMWYKEWVGLTGSTSYTADQLYGCGAPQFTLNCGADSSNWNVVASTSPTMIIDGVCGYANNMCSAGNLSDVPDTSTQYLWNCTGINGGTTATCSITKPQDGVCGTTMNSCQAGTFSDTADTSTAFKWNCVGSSGGATANCSVARAVSNATLSVSPSVVPYGGYATYSWTSGPNADACYIRQGIPPNDTGASYPANGSMVVGPLYGNRTYNGYCINWAQSSMWYFGATGNAWGDFVTVTVQPQNGACAATHWSCAPGTSINNAYGSDRWKWDCQGANGGTTATGCYEMYPVNGVCSSTHYGCSTPTASPLASQKNNLTNWTWTCPGQYGGTDTACTENKIPVNGQCGVSPTKPNHYVCNSGMTANASYNAFTYTYSWDCLGANGGTTPPRCTEILLPPPVDGVCKRDPVTNYPQHYNCQAGNSAGGYDAGASWKWNCAGAYGGVTASCEEFKPVDAVCSATHYGCTKGTLDSASTVDGALQWGWTCKGLYAGVPANCTENKAPTITWSPAVGPTIAYHTKATYSFSTTNAISCNYDATDASGNVITNIWTNGPVTAPWGNTPQGEYNDDQYRRLTCKGTDGKTTVSNYHITVLQNDSACISITPPSYLLPGQTFNATAKMWNRGANPWTTGTMNYVLARYDKLWKGNTMSLTNAPVAKDTQGNFTGSFQATTTEGVYDFSFRMQPIFNGTDWSLPAFGPTCAAQTSSGGAIVVKKATLGLTPQTYQFADTVIGDTPSTTTVHFRNLGGGTINGIKIGNISSPFACIPAGCNLTLGPGASGDIVLSFAPASTTREDRYAPITNTNTNPTVPIVDSNPPYGAVSQIYIYGKGTEKYMVSFDTAGAHPTGNADFFEVPWTTPKFMNLTITNRSKEKGGLVKPNVDASAVFSCTKNCGTTTLRPGESTTVQVKFMPNTKVDKVYTGVFNVGATPDVHVGLSGHGVQPEYRTSEK